MARIYFSDLSDRLDVSQPPAYDSLFGRQSASSRDQADTPSNTNQRDQSIQEGTAEANRKFKYYMILIVILFLASIAAIEVAYQKYFKHKCKP